MYPHVCVPPGWNHHSRFTSLALPARNLDRFEATHNVRWRDNTHDTAPIHHQRPPTCSRVETLQRGVHGLIWVKHRYPGERDSSVLHTNDLPFTQWKLFDVTKRQQPEWIPRGVDDGKCRERMGEYVVGDEIRHRDSRSNDNGITRHHLTNTHPTERGLHPHVTLLSMGGHGDEPTNQHQPHPAKTGADHGEPDTGRNEHPSEYPPCLGGTHRSTHSVAGCRPPRRTQNPPTIQWGGRNKIEHCEQPVDEGEPLDDTREQTRPTNEIQRRRQRSEHAGEHHAHQWANGGDPQIRSGARWLAFQFGHATEHPQGDRLNLNPVASGHDSVSKFVCQQGANEDRPRDDTGSDVRHDGKIGVEHGEPTGGEPEYNEEQDHHDAPVHADPDPKQPPQTECLGHMGASQFTGTLYACQAPPPGIVNLPSAAEVPSSCAVPPRGWNHGGVTSDSTNTPTTAELDQMAVQLLLDPDVRAVPFEHYRTLRTHAPLHGASFGPLWFATRYDDCHEVLRHPNTAQPPTRLPEDPEPGAAGDDEGGPFLFGRRDRDVDPTAQKSLLRLNPPDHTRLRGLVSRGFTPRRVEQLRPAVEAMTDAVLDDLADAGEGDLLDLVGFPLPVRVIGELVGVPAEDRDSFRTLVRDAATSLEPGITPEQQQAAVAAGLQLREYFNALIAERKANPRDDLTSALVAVQAAQLAGEEPGTDPLTDQEMIATLILIFAAGFETTTNLIGNGLWCLLKHPGEMERLRSDPTLAPAAVEEMLRYQSPVQMDARRTVADIEIGGQSIPRGHWIITLLGAANRDPEKFDHPEDFHIVDRPTPVLSFATGIHYCLGASLARMEGRVFFNHLLGRFNTIELTADPEWRNTFTLRGLNTLDVRVG